MTEWGFTPKQRHSIATANADASLQQINLWHGAIRSGKTIGSLVRFLMQVAEAPTSGEIVMVGRTRDTLHRNVIAPMQDPALFGEWARHIHYNRGAPTATILGRMVHVIGSSDARAENVIRGLTVCIAYVDEVSLASEEFFNQLMGRCSIPGAWVAATTNPDGPRHWLKTAWINRAEERGHRVFHFTLRDNAEHLPPGLIEAYEAQYTGLWRKRMIDGLWSLAEGAIYEQFDPDHHVVADLPSMDNLLAVGIDHGVTNPTAGILIGHHNGRLYAVAEWAPGPGTDAQRSASLAQFVAERGMPDRIHVDPAAAGFRGQLIADKVPSVYKASNAVIDGIGTVASLLSSGRLLIHESCTNLLGEIPSYVWDAKASEKGDDAPIKLNDHFCDALRYSLHSTRDLWRPLIPDLYLPDEEDANAAA